MKLTFKQYLDSKEQLRQAITQTPVVSRQYEVVDYCNLPVLDECGNKVTLSLKPKVNLVVEWNYKSASDTNPKPASILTEGLASDDEWIEAYWNGNKMQQWLCRHTRSIN